MGTSGSAELRPGYRLCEMEVVGHGARFLVHPVLTHTKALEGGKRGLRGRGGPFPVRRHLGVQHVEAHAVPLDQRRSR